MHAALLYQKLADKTVKCELCPRYCVIKNGHRGYCQTRQNIDGNLMALGYGRIVSAAADPIEKKPLFNFYPGSRVMSVGALGCNFSCLHCQNWEISQLREPGHATQTHDVSPEQLIQIALQNQCRGIAWTYNEPTINIEYAIDGAKLAKAAGLYTVLVTNGYITPEGLDLIGPWMDAFCVDIKGWNDFYPDVCKAGSIQPVLDSTIRAKQKWNMHIEVITNIIPTLNDKEQDLTAIAHWILDNLGNLVPWHVSRFYPMYKLAHLPPTPVEALVQARKIGLTAGLKYVYTGNIPGDQGENTYCPYCHNILIERAGYRIEQLNINDKKCQHCQSEVSIIL